MPSICAVEIIYLAEKGRIPSNILDAFLNELGASDTILRFADLNLPTVLALKEIPRISVPDLPDRVIAATALSLALPLISRDALIRAAGLTIIW